MYRWSPRTLAEIKLGTALGTRARCTLRSYTPAYERTHGSCTNAARLSRTRWSSMEGKGGGGGVGVEEAATIPVRNIISVSMLF